MIYFIEAVGASAIKIGYTSGRPEDRVKQLQCGCPHYLYLVGHIEGDNATEDEWHAKWKQQRLRGEWFRYGATLRSAIFAAMDSDHSHPFDVQHLVQSVRHDLSADDAEKMFRHLRRWAREDIHVPANVATVLEATDPGAFA